MNARLVIPNDAKLLQNRSQVVVESLKDRNCDKCSAEKERKKEITARDTPRLHVTAIRSRARRTKTHAQYSKKYSKKMTNAIVTDFSKSKLIRFTC